MQLGIYTGFGYNIDFKERLKLIKKTGFEYTALWWGKNGKCIHTNYKREAFAGLAHENDLKIENAHLEFENAQDIWKDNIDGENLFDSYKKDIILASKSMIPTLVLHISRGFNDMILSPLGIERLKELFMISEEYNIHLALENLKRPTYLVEIIKKINSTNLKICYDTGHENCYSKDFDIIKTFKKKIQTLHVHDNNGLEDLHLLPGDGNIDWSYKMKKLKQSGFNGILCLEVTKNNSHHYDNLSPEEYLEKAYVKSLSLLDLFNS